MTNSKRTYFNAIILLIVFSLNTVVSFACSFTDLVHSNHHHSSSPASSLKKQSNNHHEHSSSHRHEHSGNEHHDYDNSSNEEKDDCCSTSVVQLEKVEKAIARIIIAPNADLLNLFISTSFFLNTLQTVEVNTIFPEHVRWRLPATIQDLRIVIQSFQI
ncbi:MAG TPA: hypothetical protein VM368_05230 [Flavisolibacter sp.]|nr:hypothetical protein [Flavisolibacter sp.]